MVRLLFTPKSPKITNIHLTTNMDDFLTELQF